MRVEELRFQLGLPAALPHAVCIVLCPGGVDGWRGHCWPFLLCLLLPGPGKGDVKPAHLAGLKEGKAAGIYLLGNRQAGLILHPRHPGYFLRKTSNAHSQQRKVQAILAAPMRMLSLPSLSAADEPTCFLCLVLRPP